MSDSPEEQTRKFFNASSITEKTLWDWLELLIIPVIFSFGGYLVSAAAEKVQEAAVEEQYQQRLFRGYIAQISELLIDKGLTTADEFSEVKVVAQSLTESTLRDLDAQRRNSLMLFLRSTGLATPLPGSESQSGILSWSNLANIDLSETIMNAIDLHYADLENANLSQAFLGGGSNLNNVKFNNTILDKTDFRDASLQEAVFAYTNLETAENITEEQLRTAFICNTKMPDGSESDRDCAFLIEQLLCNIAPPEGSDPGAFDPPDCNQLIANYADRDYDPKHSWDHKKKL
ncbi:pentapeptide repeat-containing protein [Xenococcus sp. PCC 7305]|uniref:pentapeptide repeat-containing protein n=1 Tax=Xenococcus sp. PCC 7305 TaxID=102125 RepID=UPI0002F8E2E0|nr:pentapeptide repeat-containing protein [Xenococcus sp. PCC 7305]